MQTFSSVINEYTAGPHGETINDQKSVDTGQKQKKKKQNSTTEMVFAGFDGLL
jgi:hypothetical protein